jgi:putative sterol carrier protein
MTSADALARTLAILERDQLASYVRLADALTGLRIALEVQGETFHVQGGSSVAVEQAADEPVDARVRTSRHAILALIDGDIDLLEAVKARKLKLKADVSLMVRLARAERAFAEGAARARAVRSVLDQFRATTVDLPVSV